MRLLLAAAACCCCCLLKRVAQPWPLKGGVKPRQGKPSSVINMYNSSHFLHPPPPCSWFVRQIYFPIFVPIVKNVPSRMANGLARQDFGDHAPLYPAK